MYDPAGGYTPLNGIPRGSGDFFTSESASLNDYINYHINRGSSVETTTLPTTANQDREIEDRASEQGGTYGGYCAIAVSNALDGILDIPVGTFLPKNLANNAREAAK